MFVAKNELIGGVNGVIGQTGSHFRLTSAKNGQRNITISRHNHLIIGDFKRYD